MKKLVIVYVELWAGCPRTLRTYLVYSRYDMNTQTLRTLLKDRQFDYYMPPFVGIKPACQDRHKTVP